MADSKDDANATGTEPAPAPASREPAAAPASPPPSRRDSIRSAMEAQSKSAPAETRPSATPAAGADDKTAADRSRDERGRFAAGKATEPASQTVAPPAATPIAAEAPSSWNAEAKALWGKLDPAAQKYISQREREMGDGVATVKRDLESKARFADEIGQAVAPYQAMIQAEGGTPASAVHSLLNTAYQLRTAPPQQKALLFRQMAQQFGVDIAAVAQPEQGPPVDPAVAELRQQMSHLYGTLTAQQQADHSARMAASNDAVQQFTSAKDASGNPLHPHYAKVEQEMLPIVAQLRQARPGQPPGEILKQAYERAIWLHPEIRDSLVTERVKLEHERGRKAAEEAAAKAAQAGGSVTGSPGVGRAQAGIKSENRRALIAEQVYAGSGGARL